MNKVYIVETMKRRKNDAPQHKAFILCDECKKAGEDLKHEEVATTNKKCELCEKEG